MTCERCRPYTALAGVAVGAHYGGPVKELIWQLKFHRLRAVAVAAAEIIVPAIPSTWPLSVVTAVPIAPARYRERGYNQAELIAVQVARRLGLPYAPLLGRVTATHQLGADRQTRLEQAEGAFYHRQRAAASVLVVDDVLTTGATLSECAAVLQRTGAHQVYGAVAARH